jgi:hypothetical protein
MEQNNFEKNVQQKMDELKIAPSEAVWTNVEKRIEKKEKDRRLIFILFFLILFFLSGGYWLLNSSKVHQKNDQQISKVIEKESHSKDDLNDTLGQATNAGSSSEKSAIDSKNILPDHDSAFIQSGKIKSFKTISAIKNEKVKHEKHRNSTKEFIAKRIEVSSKQTNNADFDFELIHEINRIPLEKGKENYADRLIGNMEDKINADRFLNQFKSEKTGGKLIAWNDSAKKKISVKKQKEHWNIGFTLSGGRSFMGTNLLERSFPVADYVSNMPSGGIPSYYYQPSPIKNSTAFVIGVFIEKNISKRGKIVLGLSYKYYSLVNKVGKKVDSLLSPSTQYLSLSNSFNSFNSIHTYRNNFHYLEVPVSFKLQLNKNKKLPLSWEAGVDLSQLISSNALQFQSNPGLYYNDNSMFNKTQFGLNTALFVTLFLQQKMPFTVGPYFYYSTSRLADKGLYQNKHFSFIGIRTEILLKKK